MISLGQTNIIRRGSTPYVFVSSLQPLGLVNNTVQENTTAGTVIGAITGLTSGSSIALTTNDGARVALSGTNIVVGATALDYETAGGLRSFIVTETLAGRSNTPNASTIFYTITNQYEQANLGALSLSASAFTLGTPSSGTIIGATATSTIAASGLPGLTIDSTARTWLWDGTGTAGTGTLSLTETLADSANSPRVSSIGYTIVAAGASPFNAPVIVLTASSPIDIDVSWTPPSGESAIGYFFLTEIDNNNTFASPEQKILSGIELEDYVSLSDNTGIATPSSGTHYARVFAVRDNEFGSTLISGAKDEAGNTIPDFYADTSPASNTVTISIAATPLTATLTDNFNDGVAPATGAFYGSATATGVSVSETGGKLVVTPTNQSGDHANGAVYPTTYMLQGSQIVVNMDPGATLPGSQLVYIGYGPDANNMIALEFDSGPNCNLIKMVAGTRTATAVTFNANRSFHRWFRLEESGGNINVYSAPPSASDPPVTGDWTLKGTVAIPTGVSVTAGKIALQSRTFAATAAIAVSFDGLNTGT